MNSSEQMVEHEEEAKMKKASRITPEEIQSMRLRQERVQSDFDRPDKLFQKVYTEGLERAQALVNERYPDWEDYTDEQAQELYHDLAIELTKTIQQEFNFSLSDNDMANMYGMQRDHVIHAFGRAVEEPEPGDPANWQRPRRRRAPLKQYVMKPHEDHHDESQPEEEVA